MISPANPAGSLGTFDANSVSALIAASGDIVLVVDREGFILQVTFNNSELARALSAAGALTPDLWPGQRWDACVTIECRTKVASLLRDALDRKAPRWAHLNHLSAGDADIPVLYTAVKVGDAGNILAIGRDMRPASVLQQRLIDAQQSMERDYLRLRHAETRFRLLFETSSEALLVLDPATMKPLEANPAALTLLYGPARQTSKRPILELFDENSAANLNAMIAQTRVAGRGQPVTAHVAKNAQELVVSASMFRQDDASLVLVRLLPANALVTVANAVSSLREPLLKALDGAPDGFVLTAPDGRILATNVAFREMTELAAEEQARGASLDRWLGRPGVDFNVMTATLRQRGTVSLFATTLRGEYGATTEVEISATSLVHAEQTYYGFVIRDVGRRIHADPRAGREAPRSVEQLTELIGRVPLKDLVREATDLIERLCIEAALELTRDNRASAAELLGLSRQSLYVKLRRHGLGDLGGDEDDEA